MKGTVAPLGELSGQESPEDYHLALGAYALKSSDKIEQVLVNFESPRGMFFFQGYRLVKCSRGLTDREEFLGHLYAARYLQRMEPAFGMPQKLYHDSNPGKR